MKKLLVSAAIIAAALVPLAATAHDDGPFDRHSEDSLTLAVLGDWPYNDILLNSAHLLLNSVNSDPKVRLVLHVGDIHSGSQPCTGAGLNPIPGLYAAGELTGGIFHFNYPGGSGLTNGSVFGRSPGSHPQGSTRTARRSARLAWPSLSWPRRTGRA